jgi:hypothetical protein
VEDSVEESLALLELIEDSGHLETFHLEKVGVLSHRLRLLLFLLADTDVAFDDLQTTTDDAVILFFGLPAMVDMVDSFAN